MKHITTYFVWLNIDLFTRKSIITQFLLNAVLGAQNLKNLEASRHKMKHSRPIKITTKSLTKAGSDSRSDYGSDWVSDRIGLAFSLLVQNYYFWEKAVLTMTQVNWIFFFRAARVLVSFAAVIRVVT